MFHRVKDVRSTEQTIQQEDTKGYHQEETATLPARQDLEKTAEKSLSSSVPAYRSHIQKTQEESRTIREREDAPVQSKYTRDTEDRVGEAARRGYQPSVSGAAGYAVSHTAPVTTPAYTPPQDVYSGADRVLTIGRGINMSGEIDACDHLMVEGTVEAALKGAKLLDIAETGVFYGTVEIEEATIAGRFEGDITVNGRLTIKSTGVITGSIAYRELAVESGAMLDGRMTPLKGTVDPKSVDRYRAGTEASAMAKAKEIVGKKDNREPANADTRLFSTARGSY